MCIQQTVKVLLFWMIISAFAESLVASELMLLLLHQELSQFDESTKGFIKDFPRELEEIQERVRKEFSKADSVIHKALQENKKDVFYNHALVPIRIYYNRPGGISTQYWKGNVDLTIHDLSSPPRDLTRQTHRQLTVLKGVLNDLWNDGIVFLKQEKNTKQKAAIIKQIDFLESAVQNATATAWKYTFAAFKKSPLAFWKDRFHDIPDLSLEVQQQFMQEGPDFSSYPNAEELAKLYTAMQNFEERAAKLE